MNWLLRSAAGVALLPMAAFGPIAISGIAQAQEVVDPGETTEIPADAEEIERMTVTGSFIAGSPEDASVPVDVIGRAELDELGAPTLNELLRNVGAAQGLIGESNQFDTRGGQGNEGITTINLRGLGSARTLVLLNDRRHVADEAVGVDVQMIPLIAVERVEILKDGAAALYGSDAIAGVVNFITRNDFEGLELRGNYQLVQESDGNDWDVGGLFGYKGEAFGREYNIVVAAEYARRGEVTLADAGLIPFVSPHNSSSIGNPGTFLSPTGFIPDPNCDLLGGSNQGGFCRFPFVEFDNVVEETETIRLFQRTTVQLAPEHEMQLEALYHRTDLPEWKTSPAYPPQTLLGPANLVLPDHPGRIRFFEQNPEFAAQFNPQAPFIFWGRYQGVSGDNGPNGGQQGLPEVSQRLTKQYRGGITFKGTLFEGRLNYDIGGTYSVRDRQLNSFADMRVERFALSMRGLGGPDCDPNIGTPGVGPCEYFNPFSNTVEKSAINGVVNPQFDPSVANSEDLLNWLVDRGSSREVNRLATVDAVFSGELPVTLPGGDIGFAVGGQLRKEYFETEITDNFNLEKNPCPYTQQISVDLGFTPTLDCASLGSTPGLSAFLAPAIPQQLERNVYAFFGELALPVTDTLNVQFAIRMEDYGGLTGSTLDPKLAVRWQAMDWLALRGSIGTTFRAPALSALQGRATALAFTNATTAFKAWDTVGNPDLDPEKALASNIGVLIDYGPFSASIDYWRFDFEDPFQLEDGNQIASAYAANGCQDGGAGVGTEICDTLRDRIFPTGVPVNLLERIERTITNGADIVTDGIDFFAQVEFPWGPVDFTAGIDGTYTLSYESADFTLDNGLVVAPGGDFVGFRNQGTPFQTILALKGNFFLNGNWKNHNLRYTLRYVDDYEDTLALAASLGASEIDSFITHDINYNYNLFDGRTTVSFSVFNLTDEEPPFATRETSYDPFVHNPLGRLIKFGLVQRF